jgi:hypothetical protein
MSASQANVVTIKAHVWNEGETPTELTWEGPDLFDRIQHDLMEQLETKEFGKLVKSYSGGNGLLPGELILVYRAFTDPYRGRQIVSGLDETELNKSFEEHKQLCAQKVFSAVELYNLEPTRPVDYASYHTVRVHLPEIDSYEIDFDGVEAGRKMETRTIVDKDFDGRRGWTLQTVWFEGSPVMVVNSSGRDGDEYHERWITDVAQFGKLLTWLQRFIPRTEITGYVNLEAVIPAMTEFYGHSIHDFYDVEKKVAKE